MESGKKQKRGRREYLEWVRQETNLNLNTLFKIRGKQSQKGIFRFQEVPKLVPFTETERIMLVSKGCGGEEGMGTEFLFCKMTKFRRWGIVTVAQHVSLLNASSSTLKKVDFYAVCILPQLKKTIIGRSLACLVSGACDS